MAYSSAPSLNKLSMSCWECASFTTSSYHPNGNGGVEWGNHTMAQMLAMVVNERQDEWDLQLTSCHVRVQ